MFGRFCALPEGPREGNSYPERVQFLTIKETPNSTCERKLKLKGHNVCKMTHKSLDGIRDEIKTETVEVHTCIGKHDYDNARAA